MKCPLFRAANIVQEFDNDWSGDDCIKEGCAWWNVRLECCAVYQLAISLDAFSSTGEEILEKLPWGGKE